MNPAHSLKYAALALALAGCASGPDFQRPAAPDVAAYTATPLAAQTVAAPVHLGEAQRFGGVAEAEWWRGFKSQKLDSLIDSALAASPTLAAARATWHQAEELHAARSGATRMPQVDMNLGAQRQRMSPSSQGLAGDARQFNLLNASLGVHYDLDPAGGNRRALEALAARTDTRRHELEATRRSLAGNLAATAITRARLAGQIEVTTAILRAQEEQVELARVREHLGQATPGEALTLQTQAEQTRAELPQLRQEMQQAEHRLAVLAGRAPGAGAGVGNLPEFTLADFTLPADLPLVVPSELVRQRPDIQAAEALLHAANADYGVAVAKLYPQLNLSASLGSQALSSGALFGDGSAVWGLVGQLTQPLFNPGLPAEKRAALAAFDAAAANYQGVVLEALRQVADALRAVENDAQRLAALAAADAAAQEALQMVEQQYRLGAASYVQLLIARQQAQQTRLGVTAAQAQRLADSVALFQAMGSDVAPPARRPV